MGENVGEEGWEEGRLYEQDESHRYSFAPDIM